MTIPSILALSVLFSLPSPAANAIERAFLQNSANILREMFTTSGDIPVSLPEPLGYADEVSRDQAYFIFKQLFEVFKTSEFYVDSRLSIYPGKPGGILKARWSFRNRRTGNQYPFRVFFYVAPERPVSSAVTGGPGKVLRIVEVRAEKL